MTERKQQFGRGTRILGGAIAFAKLVVYELAKSYHQARSDAILAGAARIQDQMAAKSDPAGGKDSGQFL